MKSFASAILAAAVSANYCYSDGCNCNGETRACYSVPRQNMRPNAINTCCPVDVQPTVYGINNGRSVNIPQTASLTNINTNPAFFGTSSGNSIRAKLVATCAETFQASNCSSVAYSQRKACEKARADARTECEKTSADERTEAEKSSADERKESEKAAADERKEAEKTSADERKEAEKTSADERKEAEKAQWTNLMMKGETEATWSPTARLAGSNSATWSPTARLTGSNPVTWAPTATLNANFVDCRDYSLYCCQEWNRFEYECILKDLPASNTNCSSVVSAAKNAGITADSPGTCAQTSNLSTCTDSTCVQSGCDPNDDDACYQYYGMDYNYSNATDILMTNGYGVNATQFPVEVVDAENATTASGTIFFAGVSEKVKDVASSAVQATWNKFPQYQKFGDHPDWYNFSTTRSFIPWFQYSEGRRAWRQSEQEYIMGVNTYYNGHSILVVDDSVRIFYSLNSKADGPATNFNPGYVQQTFWSNNTKCGTWTKTTDSGTVSTTDYPACPKTSTQIGI